MMIVVECVSGIINLHVTLNCRTELIKNQTANFPWNSRLKIIKKRSIDE